MLSSAGDAISLYLSDIAANLDYSVQQITFMEAEQDDIAGSYFSARRAFRGAALYAFQYDRVPKVPDSRHHTVTMHRYRDLLSGFKKLYGLGEKYIVVYCKLIHFVCMGILFVFQKTNLRKNFVKLGGFKKNN